MKKKAKHTKAKAAWQAASDIVMAEIEAEAKAWEKAINPKKDA